MAWTDDRIQLLKQYWEEGRSASQIAELLGEGLTRNAVIGKAHRLGLSSRPSPLKGGDAKSAEPRATPARKPAARKAAAPAARAEPAAPPEPVADVAPPEAPPVRVAPPPPPRPAPEPQPRPAFTPPPAADLPPPRPVVAAKNARGGKVTLLDLNDRICKWPIGHPDEADFHFCGRPVSPGFPYCGDHCLQAYQAQMPRRDRPAGPPRPFGPNLPRPR